MSERTEDTTSEGFAPLHVRSWFSFRAGGSSPEALAAEAARLGYRALALTDAHGLYGAVRHACACAEHGLRPIYGAEVGLIGDDQDDLAQGSAERIVLLAMDRTGYAGLNRLLGCAHARDRLAPHATLDELAGHAAGLLCLTGGRGSRLWRLLDTERPADAQAWVGLLHEVFGDRLSVELAGHLAPGDRYRTHRLARLAHRLGVPTAASGDVRHASAADYRRYDLLTCIRLGIPVARHHPERPVNAEARLLSEADLRRRIPVPEAFARAAELAAACRVELLPGALEPPAARRPSADVFPPVAVSADEHLRTLCEAGFRHRYPDGSSARDEARQRLEHELSVIADTGLADYFLVVREVVGEAHRRGIRCAGRGSAAGSVVAYLLGVTGVCPVAHQLLFERFLHRGRRGTPDIDLDFDSERREEMIAWIESRFGREHTAMTGTVVTYRLRSAVRDTAKALGWDADAAGRASKAVMPGSPRRVAEHRTAIAAALRVAAEAPMMDALVEAVALLQDCPRHLGQHSGGMVLARAPLAERTAVQPSANGVPIVQHDKDDVESLGLVKLDVLALRMLAAISEADTLVRRAAATWGLAPDRQGYPLHRSLGELPLDDSRTFNLIRSGRTMGCFQIESHGQMHLLAMHQPDTFADLITEIALFRPGPLQGGMVHPYVRRRRGLEPVIYDHPSLEPVLGSTQGIILFQEQVLEVAHAFAGMDLDEADAFRSLMSKFRDPGEMEGMRARFIEGAMATHAASEHPVTEVLAERVFGQVSKFVGYGFCRSHAAAFAHHVYLSCYLKAHHPAAYLAGIMQHRPGMFDLQSLQDEARRFGVAVLPADVRVSGTRYDVEPAEYGASEHGASEAASPLPRRTPSRPSVRRSPLAIRMPLTAAAGVTPDDARVLVLARAERPYRDLEDLWRRAAVSVDTMRGLAKAGTLDGLVAGDQRRALWEVGVLARRLGVPGRIEEQTTLALHTGPVVAPDDVPALAPLRQAERVSWSLAMTGAAEVHPMTLARRVLMDLEVRPIATAWPLGSALGQLRRGPARGIPGTRRGGVRPLLTVAGIVTMRQRPPTANGVMFVTLEDETGFVQCVVHPEVADAFEAVLRRSALIVRGELQSKANWRGLVVQAAWALDGVLGGYEGHLSMAGGRDRLVVEA